MAQLPYQSERENGDGNRALATPAVVVVVEDGLRDQRVFNGIIEDLKQGGESRRGDTQQGLRSQEESAGLGKTGRRSLL